jgi:Family of unknown function (DUF6064)
MGTPFSPEQFLDVFRRYNEAVWPAQFLLFALALALMLLVPRSKTTGRRAVFGTLAFLWLWMGVAYHLVFFTTINSAAWVFGALFIVQAALFARAAAHPGPGVELRADARGVIGALLMIYALAGHLVVGFMVGQTYPAIPTFGLPCPTTIFTFGVLVWMARTAPRILWIIPTLWAIVGTVAAVHLGMVEDFGLPIAAAVALLSLSVARGAAQPTVDGAAQQA